HAHDHENGMTTHEVKAAVALVARPIGQGDRCRIHHQQTKEQQRAGRNDQAQIDTGHRGAPWPNRIETRAQFAEHTHATSPWSAASSCTASTKQAARWT